MGCLVAVGLLAGQSSASLADDASGSILALATAADGSVLFKSTEAGLFRSVDQGQSWAEAALPVPDGTPIRTVAIVGGGGEVYYALAQGFGLLASNDKGITWSAVDGNLPDDVTSLAAHSTQPETLYAYSPTTGIYRSKDAGTGWQLMDKGPDDIDQLIHTNMAGSMESGWLYAATAKGVLFSMDCFCLWREAVGIDAAATAVVVNPDLPEELFAAAGKELFRSENGGQEWAPLSSAPEAITALTFISPASILAGTVGGRLLLLKRDSDTWEQVGG